MAYARYGGSCDQYIFWESTKEDVEMAAAGQPKPKSQETLAVWHAGHRTAASNFTYSQVRAMLDSGDFAPVIGFQESSRALLTECMLAFCEEVDQERDQAV